MNHPLAEFGGTQRFETRRCLGEGAMGAVYEAYDRERDAVVALKRLLRVDAAGIYRLKQEFRALAHIAHPNLVSLHELVHDQDEWFLVMELIQGLSFLQYVRGGGREVDVTLDTNELRGVSRRRVIPVPVSSPSRGLDLDRLRVALYQIAEGVDALHRHGKLHRDIKPSNVLVTDTERVVILDFGLVDDDGHDRLLETVSEHGALGTPGYMSPEQAAGQRASPASDWYAVGVMLYRALTGQLPFSGGIVQVMQEKQQRDPLPPSALVEQVPSDLEALCMALLARHPSERPTGTDVLRRLSRDPGSVSAGAVQSRRSSEPPVLVGREQPLAALDDAFRRSRQGGPVVVFVDGQTGVGKTALVTQFLEGLRNRPDTVILPGRCYERETVPFKAFDSVVDSLSRYLNSLPPADAAELLPRDVKSLARVFPVLRRVKAVSRSRRRPLETQDPGLLRRHAIGALRDLLCRIADSTPLVVFVDDLQWGDTDSAALLADLLAPPEPPDLLFIGVYRHDEMAESPLMQAWIEASRRIAQQVQVREIRLSTLSTDQAHALARMLLPQSVSDAEQLAATIARESLGVPFFVRQLAHWVDGGQANGSGSNELSLDRVLRERIDQLVPMARRLLEIVAVAGGPIQQGVALTGAGLGKEGRGLLAMLRAEKWVRTRGARITDAVEVYHDRMRHAVLAGLDERVVRERQARLSEALARVAQQSPRTPGLTPA